jgi:hypothetical protein
MIRNSIWDDAPLNLCLRALSLVKQRFCWDDQVSGMYWNILVTALTSFKSRVFHKFLQAVAVNQMVRSTSITYTVHTVMTLLNNVHLQIMTKQNKLLGVGPRANYND